MLFNPDITKQAQEVIFSRKHIKIDRPIVYFNEAPVAHTTCQNYLGRQLDEKLNFNHHLEEKIAKANKGIGLICKLAHILPRQSLLTIYKSFIRPHLDYGDIVYDQPNNENFCNTIEKVQYNAALAITGAIKGTSKLKIYNELGIESLKFRRWSRRLCVFFKIKTTKIPKYLYELIPTESHIYNTRKTENVETYYCRTDLFKYSFFPYTIVEWNKLDINLRNVKSFQIFRNSLLKIARLMQNSIFNVHDPVGIKYLTRLRLGLSHLNEHKFRHNFQDCLNPFCSCILEVETVIHYFLHCHYYNIIRRTLLDTVNEIINKNLSDLSEQTLVNLLLYGNPSLTFEENKEIIKASIIFIHSSQRFAGALV